MGDDLPSAFPCLYNGHNSGQVGALLWQMAVGGGVDFSHALLDNSDFVAPAMPDILRRRAALPENI